MKVADLIGSRKEVFSITEETSVHQAAQYLREKQVRSVGVMNASGKLVGVISHSDVSSISSCWMGSRDFSACSLSAISCESWPRTRRRGQTCLNRSFSRKDRVAEMCIWNWRARPSTNPAGSVVDKVNFVRYPIA